MAASEDLGVVVAEEDEGNGEVHGGVVDEKGVEQKQLDDNGQVPGVEVEEQELTLREQLLSAIASLEPPSRLFELKWTNQATIPRATERRVLPLLVERGFYGALQPERWDLANRFIKRGEFWLLREQAQSLYSQHLAENVMHSHRHFKEQLPRLIEQYRRGTSVLKLTRSARTSPVTVMREVLKQKWNCCNQDVKAALAPDSDLFNARDRRELRTAEDNDIVANIDKSANQLKAVEFEERVLRHFAEQLGIRCQSEAELQEMQRNRKQMATPDLLFLDRVTINGHEVFWIDAKNMYGSTVKMTVKRQREQADKYIRAFGPGAFLFSCSFCSDLHIPGVLLLEAQSVPGLAVPW